MSKIKNPKVIVAISGGIDSSVAAALLKEKGYQVQGVFMKLCDLPRFRKAEKRAERVAKVLGIPFLVLDLRREFKKKVIDYFLKEYKAGTTPNPCVVCNKEIKFGILLKKLKKLGIKFDFIATGHYARISHLNFSAGAKKVKWRILKAKDKEKDQTYFLWGLKQKQLKKVLFPIGGYTGRQVKSLARKFNIPVYEGSSSQDVCFIPKTTSDFLRKNIKQKCGLIIDTKGRIIGQHQGLVFYTIGQRKGIKLGGGPYFVLAKDIKRNILIVTKNERDLAKKELLAKGVNWISGIVPKLPLKVKAKIRYRHKEASTIITKDKRTRRYKLRFQRPQRAITPGQSVVFYQGDELLGGGIIDRSY